MLTILSIRVLSMQIIVVLNSQSDNSNMPVMSGLGGWSVFSKKKKTPEFSGIFQNGFFSPPLSRSTKIFSLIFIGFLGNSAGKESLCNAGDPNSISGLGRSPGEWNSYPLQYSGLENSMDRGTWQATVYGVTKRRTWLSNFHFYFHGNLFIFRR